MVACEGSSVPLFNGSLKRKSLRTVPQADDFWRQRAEHIARQDGKLSLAVRPKFDLITKLPVRPAILCDANIGRELVQLPTGRFPYTMMNPSSDEISNNLSSGPAEAWTTTVQPDMGVDVKIAATRHAVVGRLQ